MKPSTQRKHRLTRAVITYLERSHYNPRIIRDRLNLSCLSRSSSISSTSSLPTSLHLNSPHISNSTHLQQSPRASVSNNSQQSPHARAEESCFECLELNGRVNSLFDVISRLDSKIYGLSCFS